jgi:CheY-like chemotaxis protein
MHHLLWFPLVSSTGLILMVEDNPDDRLILDCALKRADLNTPVKIVHDGEEAIRYLNGDGEYADREQHPLPSLLVIDLKMPRISGLEVLSWVRKQETGLRQLPIIVLTTSEYTRDVMSAYEAGANAYLVKPNDLHLFIRQMKSLNAFWLKACRLPAIVNS